MFLSYLHKFWQFLIRALAVTTATIAVLLGLVLGLIQLPVVQNYLLNSVEQQFNNTYYGTIELGSIDGFIPKTIALNDARLFAAAEDSAATPKRGPLVARIDRISLRLDLSDLLTRKVTITGLDLDAPEIDLKATSDSSYSLIKALQARKKSTEIPLWLKSIQVVAPQVMVSNGALSVDTIYNLPKNWNIPLPLHIDSISTDIFVELGDKQRYLDIETFSAQVPQLQMKKFEASGQLFNDERFLEFNGFKVRSGKSSAQLSGEFEGINLYERDWPAQFKQARLDVSLDSSEIDLGQWQNIIPNLPVLKYPVRTRFAAEGRLDSLWIDRLAASYHGSSIFLEGFVRNINHIEDLTYKADIRSLAVAQSDAHEMEALFEQPWLAKIPEIHVRGSLNGSRKKARIDLSVNYDKGRVDVEGDIQWDPAYKYTLYASGSDLKLPETLWKNGRTDLNFSIALNGAGINPRTAVGNAEVTLRDSNIEDLNIDNARLQLSFVDGFFEPNFELNAEEQSVELAGWLDWDEVTPQINLQGQVSNFDIDKYPISWPKDSVTTSINGQFEANITGNNWERSYGTVDVAWEPSLINRDTINAGYLNVALNEPTETKRILSLNSSLADLEISGSFDRDRIKRSIQHWRPYFVESAKQLINVEADSTIYSLENEGVYLPFEYPIDLSATVRLKSLQSVKRWIPDDYSIADGSKLALKIQANANTLTSSGSWSIPNSRIGNEVRIDSLEGDYQARFRYAVPLKKETDVQIHLSALHLDAGNMPMDSLLVRFDWTRDSLDLKTSFSGLQDAVDSRLQVRGKMSERQIDIDLPEFYVGSDSYNWRNEGTPSMTLYKNRRIQFDDVIFKNGDQQVQVSGVYSQNRSDSLRFSLNDMDLRLISDLIGGRVRFSGNLNGAFTTSALRTDPYVVGTVNVTQGRVNGNVVGDVKLSSRYNTNLTRFDTDLVINTDTTTYSDYIESNNENRTQIRGKGWIKTNNFSSAADTLYRMDFDFEQIDGWVVNVISPNIFEETRGRGEGEGYITGNFQDFDFNADFYVDDLYGRPEFLNTNYYMTGHVEVDRNRGVIFDSLSVRDGLRGNGILYGSVDLNDFEPVKYMDIWLRLDELEFLRKTFDRDTPFYGTVAGSGLVRVSGPNYNPFLRSIEPIETTPRSVFSIPLLEETEVTEDRKFIQFVKEFSMDKKSGDIQNEIINNDQSNDAESPTLSNQVTTTSGDPVIDPSDLTFTELFELDLQFIASPNSTVELIFDQIAGEVLTAQGSGQIQITLEDEVLQMFGRFNISGGEYQFVSGDIFTRRFFLEEGGNIQWEGNPYNARLNINTVYRARPTITSLINATSQNAVTATEENQSRRIPIDLLLEIRGTLEEVENNFYFRLPTNELEGAQNTALANQISLLNNEEQKLLQATSLLLTGNFLPIASSANQGVADLRQNLSTGVVLSPLLSSQVNSLLKSNLSNLNLANNLDIDLNVTTFYELDLGIALRLFDDRLILRREGQITGVQGANQSVLGDVGATYRINEALSISYFHRQDQLFSAIADFQTAQASQPLNGIGLEAQVQFNTWNDLKNRIRRSFRKLFGRKEKAVREKQTGLADTKYRD